MKLSKVFYADEDENEIISTLFYIHKDLDACLTRTAADISQIIGQVPCINEVCSIQFIAKMDFLSKIWYVILRVITKMTVIWYRNDRCMAKMTVSLPPKWPLYDQNDRYCWPKWSLFEINPKWPLFNASKNYRSFWLDMIPKWPLFGKNTKMTVVRPNKFIGHFREIWYQNDRYF